MIRRPPRSTPLYSSAASDVYKRQVYDMTANVGWVNVGTDADTGAFAVESIRRWWTTIGEAAYPGATKLLITADAGGSNGSRLRLWKVELAKLAFELDLPQPQPGTVGATGVGGDEQLGGPR